MRRIPNRFRGGAAIPQAAGFQNSLKFREGAIRQWNTGIASHIGKRDLLTKLKQRMRLIDHQPNRHSAKANAGNGGVSGSWDIGIGSHPGVNHPFPQKLQRPFIFMKVKTPGNPTCWSWLTEQRARPVLRLQTQRPAKGPPHRLVNAALKG